MYKYLFCPTVFTADPATATNESFVERTRFISIQLDGDLASFMERYQLPTDLQWRYNGTWQYLLHKVRDQQNYHTTIRVQFRQCIRMSSLSPD